MFFALLFVVTKWDLKIDFYFTEFWASFLRIINFIHNCKCQLLCRGLRASCRPNFDILKHQRRTLERYSPHIQCLLRLCRLSKSDRDLQEWSRTNGIHRRLCKRHDFLLHLKQNWSFKKFRSIFSLSPLPAQMKPSWSSKSSPSRVSLSWVWHELRSIIGSSIFFKKTW